MFRIAKARPRPKSPIRDVNLMHGPASQSDCDGDWSNWAGDTDKRASGSVDIPNCGIEDRKAGGATSVTLIKNAQKERVCSFHFMYFSVSWLSTNKTSEEEGERDISTYVLLYGKFISHDHGLITARIPGLPHRAQLPAFCLKAASRPLVEESC